MKLGFRPVLLTALALGFVFFLGFLSSNVLNLQRSAPAAAGGLPSGNGDVNGDGEVDVGDVIYTLTYLFLGGDPPVAISSSAGQNITALIVRHGEKESGDDPGLTPEGQARANFLKEVLARTHIDAVFGTELRRTRETVQPAADARGLAIQVVDSESPGEQADALRALPPGSVALVAGHSFNIPGLLDALGAGSVAVTTYDNLWVVRFGSSPDAGASMLNFRYGKEVVP